MDWFNIYFKITFFIVSLKNIEAKCSDDSEISCYGNGVCQNDMCYCFDGWQGPQCQFCEGKIKLTSPTGVIYDGIGNYSAGAKCSWLIMAPNSSITLHVEEFATECGWDNFYVYDGDSVDAPLLAILSGLMYTKGYRSRKIPEIVAKSGAVLLHFSSDDAYNMFGFNLTYRLNACPSQVSGVDCSGHGVCIDGVCTCDAEWTGTACHVAKCPNNCNYDRGSCDKIKGCMCTSAYRGGDCGQMESFGYWEIIRYPSGSFIPPGSASHGAVVWKDSLYIVAGENYAKENFMQMYIYNFNGNAWEKAHFGDVSPSPRYDHSTVLYEDKIFLYGGVLENRGPTSELWVFDISAKNWEKITVKTQLCINGQICSPLKSAGHSATIVGDRMIIIFGYSTNFGYLNTVQEFYFATKEWHVVDTYGFPVKGGYGHSASWDPLTKKIYVYGGIVSENELTQGFSNRLYSYEPDTRLWTLLASTSSSRFLHSATFISPGLMLIFGGNTRNVISHSDDARCYSSDLLAYDVLCDKWLQLSVSHELQSDLARFGHSAVMFEKSLYIYGGFDGQMLNDMLKYTPGWCSQFDTQETCLNSLPGVKCIWDCEKKNKCVTVAESSRSDMLTKSHQLNGVVFKCPANHSSIVYHKIQYNEACSTFTDCFSCVQTTRNCVWCGGVCAREKCQKETDITPITELNQCPEDLASVCRQLHTCPACGLNPNCRWDHEAGCKPLVISVNSTESPEPVTCSRVCSEFTSCNNCTQEECIWCHNKDRCVDKNAYTTSFPYGECRDWTTERRRCRNRETNNNSQCSIFSNCGQCRNEPACGWCDDGSDTGLGKCLEGGSAGPTLHEHSLPSSTCPHERWHFTTCPSCQCNGHANCSANTNVCEPCENNTTGNHCESCLPYYYWGSSENGGHCFPCECNGQTSTCHPETGKCFCIIKGSAGDHCEKCDVSNHYHEEPSKKNTCYYDLSTDYQFTFNLSKKEDRHFTQINFRNSPFKPDVDIDFSITCSVMAKLNISVKKGNESEHSILTGYNLHSSQTFKSNFPAIDYILDKNNVTLTKFYISVYDFRPPLWIKISFSQYPRLNVQQLLVTLGTLGTLSKLNTLVQP